MFGMTVGWPVLIFLQDMVDGRLLMPHRRKLVMVSLVGPWNELLLLTTTELPILYYIPMKRLNKSCQKHKIGKLLLSSRYITNYVKLEHFYILISMEVVENLLSKVMVKKSFIEKVYIAGTSSIDSKTIPIQIV